MPSRCRSTRWPTVCACSCSTPGCTTATPTAPTATAAPRARRPAGLLGVDALRDIDVAGLDDALDRLGDDELRRRARHVVLENARVVDTVSALRDADWQRVGALMAASHASLRDDYEVSCDELDVAVEAATTAGAVGARMTGGGFGGSAIALVPARSVPAVRDAVTAAFRGRGWSDPTVFEVTPSAGAHRDPPDADAPQRRPGIMITPFRRPDTSARSSGSRSSSPAGRGGGRGGQPAIRLARPSSSAPRNSSVLRWGWSGRHEQGEVLGHLTVLDGLDADLLERLGEPGHLGGAVELAAVLEPAGPRVDRRDRVGRGRLALLVLAEVPGHRAVRRLGLDGLAVGGHQHRGHQAERAEALRDGVGLHVTVVVLARPDVAALPLHRGGDHVVDQPVLVGQTRGVEVGLELGLEDLGEDVLERAVVRLEDRVLRRQVDGIVALQPVGQRRASEVRDRVVEVVHPHCDSAIGAVVGDYVLDGVGAVLGRERDGELSGAGHLEVRRLVLVAVGVTADDDRLGPAGHQPRDVADDDRLAEHDAAEDVADRAVGRDPHLLQAELLDPRLVGGDGRALDADAVPLDGVGGVDGHLVVGRVTVLDAQVVVVEVDVEVGVDQPVLDERPDDAGHLVAVELDDGVLHLDLRHGRASSSAAIAGGFRLVHDRL